MEKSDISQTTQEQANVSQRRDFTRLIASSSHAKVIEEKTSGDVYQTRDASSEQKDPRETSEGDLSDKLARADQPIISKEAIKDLLYTPLESRHLIDAKEFFNPRLELKHSITSLESNLESAKDIIDMLPENEKHRFLDRITKAEAKVVKATEQLTDGKISNKELLDSIHTLRYYTKSTEIWELHNPHDLQGNTTESLSSRQSDSQPENDLMKQDSPPMKSCPLDQKSGHPQLIHFSSYLEQPLQEVIKMYKYNIDKTAMYCYDHFDKLQQSGYIDTINRSINMIVSCRMAIAQSELVLLRTFDPSKSLAISKYLSKFNEFLSRLWKEMHQKIRRNNGVLEPSDEEFTEARSKLGRKMPEILDYIITINNINKRLTELDTDKYKNIITNNSKNLETIQAVNQYFQRDEASFEELQKSFKIVESIISKLPEKTEILREIERREKGKGKLENEEALSSEEIVIATDENGRSSSIQRS